MNLLLSHIENFQNYENYEYVPFKNKKKQLYILKLFNGWPREYNF